MITRCVITEAPSEPGHEADLAYTVLVDLDDAVSEFEGVVTSNRIWEDEILCVPARVGTNWSVFVQDGEPLKFQILHGAASKEGCDP